MQWLHIKTTYCKFSYQPDTDVYSFAIVFLSTYDTITN